MQKPDRHRNTRKPNSKSSPEVAVVVATLGRARVVAQTLRRIENQTYKPATIIISCAAAEDFDDASDWPNVTVVTGPVGLAAQRNTALSALSEAIEIVVFFDDDFVPAADWIEIAVRAFNDNVDVVGFTGSLIADGIKGPGLSFEDADRLIEQAPPIGLVSLVEPFSPYGCNMAFRRSAVGSLRFDERLVLYGWLEDRDFGAKLKSKGGRLVKCMQAQGVHLGVKSGRVAGDRLGYSQVINPLYMLRKGTMTYIQVVDHIFRNVISNLVGSLRPEPYVDRRGRLRGNIRAGLDALLGRLDPERAVRNVQKPE
ncbi:hypothetical protein GOFOIKOB_6401 [Methylobacterium tardum]|uniref:Glycosyl transferase n=1 Tax=Methylobacterium tardum TaxID=374432 RepID=A0AA37T7F9_9HYPH|nr:glycosyltransferase family A protein [Methylobacterium tardum]URD37881.1 glycosyltransferase family 2 protein [Methylobacterium tardum]GJE53322.1 hypothetical protein GOFOIKOB_6401 [Methylobacterium tardum]GLS68105.1 glycosyl transferase [Methylobacterium tardum]